MNINEVIKSGVYTSKVIEFMNNKIVSDIKTLIIILFVALAVVVIILSLANNGLNSDTHVTVLIFVAIAVIGFAVSLGTKMIIKGERAEFVMEWKSDTAYPFIDNLELQIIEKFYISRTSLSDTNLKTTPQYQKDRGTSFMSAEITFEQNGKAETVRGELHTMIEVENLKKPKLEFVYLKKDLGNGIKKGIYNPVLYLPKGFSFN